MECDHTRMESKNSCKSYWRSGVSKTCKRQCVLAWNDERTDRAYAQGQQKEPLISHAIPERPWEKVGSDHFEYEGGDFLVTVDYFSNFFELDQLRSKTSNEVIGKLKSHFARYGVPDQFITDNGRHITQKPFVSLQGSLSSSISPVLLDIRSPMESQRMHG